MLSLHYANNAAEKANKRRLTPEIDSATVMDRIAWMEWVRRSRRSHSNLIDQEDVDPQIEEHMVMTSCVNGFAKQINMATPAKPTIDLYNKGRRRVSVKRSSFVECKRDPAEAPAKDALGGTKRKESHHRSDGNEPLNTPQLVRVTTSMVLDYQEGIWQTIQLERQAHLPPPPNHQKRQYIQDLSESSIEDVGEYEKMSQEMTHRNSRSSCPVCSSAIRLPVMQEIFHCDSCGAFASAELVRSLAHGSPP